VNSPTPITIFETKTTEGATNAGVMQDKSGLIRDRSASGQPERIPDEIRSGQNHVQSPQSNTADPQRSNTTGIHTTTIDCLEADGPLVPITIHIPKRWKAEIQRIAMQEGESDSATARAFLGRGLQENIDMQYGAMLRPVIQDQIHKDIQSYSDRQANINLQTLNSAEQNRNLSIHILRFITDLVGSPDELPLIITASQQLAWDNVKNLHRKKTADQGAEEDYREWQS
jgi:hypothetical protein